MFCGWIGKGTYINSIEFYNGGLWGPDVSWGNIKIKGPKALAAWDDAFALSSGKFGNNILIFGEARDKEQKN